MGARNLGELLALKFVGGDAGVILDRAMSTPPEIQDFLQKLLKG